MFAPNEKVKINWSVDDIVLVGLVPRADTVHQMAGTWRRTHPDRHWCLADPIGPAPELAVAIAGVADAVAVRVQWKM